MSAERTKSPPSASRPAHVIGAYQDDVSYLKPALPFHASPHRLSRDLVTVEKEANGFISQSKPFRSLINRACLCRPIRTPALLAMDRAMQWAFPVRGTGQIVVGGLRVGVELALTGRATGFRVVVVFLSSLCHFLELWYESIVPKAV